MNLNSQAKRIMIYGDSYTFGKVPGGTRYDTRSRFTGVIQAELGNDYDVIEEGLRGRMLFGENKFFPFRNGAEQFGPILGSHLPLDLVVIALGTNDANSGDQTPEQTVSEIVKYVDKIKWWSEHLGFLCPQLLIVVPPMVDEDSSLPVFGNIFKGGQAKLVSIQKLIIEFCQNQNVSYVDLSTDIVVSKVDGIHLDIENNRKYGIVLANKIKSILSA